MRKKDMEIREIGAGLYRAIMAGAHLEVGIAIPVPRRRCRIDLETHSIRLWTPS